MKPVCTGIALSLTVAIFYSLCTLIWVFLPDQFMTFMNSLFHGLDFSKLQIPGHYTWPSFFYSLIVLAVWGLAIGTFFSWIHNVLSQRK